MWNYMLTTLFNENQNKPFIVYTCCSVKSVFIKIKLRIIITINDINIFFFLSIPHNTKSRFHSMKMVVFWCCRNTGRKAKRTSVTYRRKYEERQKAKKKQQFQCQLCWREEKNNWKCYGHSAVKYDPTYTSMWIHRFVTKM